MRPIDVILPALLALPVAASVPFAAKPPPDVFFAKPQFTTRYECALRGGGQRTVEALLGEIATNGFPCGVFAVECDWPVYPGSMAFDVKEFPDPAAMFGMMR